MTRAGCESSASPCGKTKEAADCACDGCSDPDEAHESPFSALSAKIAGWTWRRRSPISRDLSLLPSLDLAAHLQFGARHLIGFALGGLLDPGNHRPHSNRKGKLAVRSTGGHEEDNDGSPGDDGGGGDGTSDDSDDSDNSDDGDNSDNSDNSDDSDDSDDNIASLVENGTSDPVAIPVETTTTDSTNSTTVQGPTTAPGETAGTSSSGGTASSGDSSGGTSTVTVVDGPLSAPLPTTETSPQGSQQAPSSSGANGAPEKGGASEGSSPANSSNNNPVDPTIALWCTMHALVVYYACYNVIKDPVRCGNAFAKAFVDCVNESPQ